MPLLLAEDVTEASLDELEKEMLKWKKYKEDHAQIFTLVSKIVQEYLIFQVISKITFLYIYVSLFA